MTGGGRVRVAGLGFDSLTEASVVEHVMVALGRGQGGWIATPNVDICRAAGRSTAQRALVSSASLVVPDGMPLLWAARLKGTPLPERVTGASLIFSITAAAVAHGQSVYLLGGETGIPDRAGAELSRRFPGTRIAGADAPAAGFDGFSAGIEAVRSRLLAAAPNIVFVGLGFPRQEQLIAHLAPSLPGAWFVGCGAAIPFAAGALPRAPGWMQKAGLEWVFRLLKEPRRLFRRYLVNDIPYAARLMVTSAAAGLVRRAARRYPSGR